MVVVKARVDNEYVTILESELNSLGQPIHYVRFEDGFHARVSAKDVKIISFQRKPPYGSEVRKVQDLQ